DTRGPDIDEGFSTENDSPEQETDNKDRNTSNASSNAIFESNPEYKIRTPCLWPNNHQFEDSSIDTELRAWTNSVGFRLRIDLRQSGRTKDSDCILIYQCNKGGKYKSKKTPNVAQQRTKLSKCTECPYRLTFKSRAKRGRPWSIYDTSNDEHNHVLTTDVSKFESVAELTEELKQEIKHCQAAGFKTTQTRQFLEEKFPGHNFKPRAISYAMSKFKAAMQEPDTNRVAEMLNLLKQWKLRDDRWFFDFERDENNRLQRVFWMSPSQQDLYRRYSDVIINDRFELEDAAKDHVRSVWTRNYSMETEDHDYDNLNLPLLDPDDNSELAILGFTGWRKEGDELEGFAASPIVKELPLSFWKRSCDSYPQLTRMVRDYFAIPATSAPSERSFSKGRALLPYNRSRLGPQKVKEQLALDSWYEYFSQNIKEYFHEDEEDSKMKHWGEEEYELVLDWLEDGDNFDMLHGSIQKTQVGIKPKTTTQAWKIFTDWFNDRANTSHSDSVYEGTIKSD
ncbi:hypothetical protein BGX27_002988, partial [Mortierella sp. AM989]